MEDVPRRRQGAWNSLKDVITNLQPSLFKPPTEVPFADDKSVDSMPQTPADEVRSSISAPGEFYHHQRHHKDNDTMSASRQRSKSSSKGLKSGSASKTSRPEDVQRRPSLPLYAEPESIEPWPQIQRLHEQLDEKNLAIEKLQLMNQGLKADLLKHLSDPYAKHKSPDSEIQRNFEQLLHQVEQTARRLCDLTRNDPQVLIAAIGATIIEERVQNHEQLDTAAKLLRDKYRGKFFQKSVAEMLLFRVLMRFALPPRILSTSITQSENSTSYSFMSSMMTRAEMPGEDSTGVDPEKWRLDTVIYLSQHSDASDYIQRNREEMLIALRKTFREVGDTSTILEGFVDMGLDFAQLLQKQKSIYYFENLRGRFDEEYMDFQDPRQSDYLRDSDELQPDHVLVSFYPALVKMSTSGRVTIAKGKALYSPLDYT